MRKMSIKTAEKKIQHEVIEKESEDINQISLEIMAALDILEIPYIVDFKDPDCGICCEKHLIAIAFEVGSLNSDDIYLNVPHKDRISVEYPGCKHMFHTKCVYESCNSGNCLGIKSSNARKTFNIECGYCRHTFYDKGFLNNLFAKSTSDLYNPAMTPVSSTHAPKKISNDTGLTLPLPGSTSKYKHLQCKQILKSTNKQCKNTAWVLKNSDSSNVYCGKHKHLHNDTNK